MSAKSDEVCVRCDRANVSLEEALQQSVIFERVDAISLKIRFQPKTDVIKIWL